MSSRKRSASSRRSYHHGDLKRALMDAALRLVESAGPQGFSMADLAREAGVSSGAPYRHFKDKHALLEALALEGLERLLADGERERARQGDAGPLAQFRALGVASVVFAVEHPGYFRVMNSPEILDRSGSPELAAVREGADAATRSMVDGAAAAGELATDPRVSILTAQALMYGLARMLVDGLLTPVSTDEARQLAIAVTEVLGHGLVPRGPSS
ncbi:MAG: TetR/AcrR family transcriptional regulator [Myxococcales bacterium]|nr:TetR/AcrR family transcriptional regulator [Myxococcales bacterium]MCB9753934.1 TetR/AcrR family transcriptional regulator [Myxococcales bacterium]